MSDIQAAAATAAPTKPFGLVAVYDSPGELYHACEALRDAGYKDFDAHTPFPVHGLENAMGIKPSKIPWVSLTGAISGLSFMVWLAYYTQKQDFPQVISGKEAFSWQAFVPLFFELTILATALFTFFGLWGMNKLPQFWHPVMTHPKFPAATDDKFLISVEAKDPKYDASATRELLQKHGGHDVEEVMS
jgi:hypothetical protein